MPTVWAIRLTSRPSIIQRTAPASSPPRPDSGSSPMGRRQAPVALYELLCDGHHSYPGSRPMVGEKVIDPRTIRPELSDAIAEFLLKACAADRADRFTTAKEMKSVLEVAR
jgi:hypothetical protein